MATITVLGLGSMGHALALSLLKVPGNKVTVWNRTEGKDKKLVAQGALRAKTIDDAVQASSVIIVCLLDYPSIQAVLEPISHKLCTKTVFNLTTGRPDEAKKMSDWAKDLKITYVEGGIMAIPAMIGTEHAIILYSGVAEDVFNEYRTLLEAMSQVRYVGADPDLAVLLDLSANAAITMAVGGAVQALAMVNSRNVDLENFSNSLLIPYMSAISGIIPHFVQQITSKDYTKDVISRVAQMTKGLANIRQTSCDLNISSEMLDPIQLLIDRRIASGYSNDEFSGVLEELKISKICNGERTDENLDESIEKQTDEHFLTSKERKKILYTFNQTKTPFPSDVCVQKLFEQQVERNSKAIAMVHKNEKISYNELNRQANRLANYLRTKGIQPDDRVAICAKRGIPLIVAIFGILKSGGLYIPVDPAYPSKRLFRILDDAQPKFVLADAVGEAVIGEHCKSVLALEEAFKNAETLENCEDNPHIAGLTSRNLAYIIYTSGSTGAPKGVMVEHRSLCNLVAAQGKLFNVTYDSRVLQFFSVSFDACVSEIFVTLCNGATLCLFDAKVDELANALQNQQITHVTITPTVLATLSKDVSFPNLSTLIMAGEKCPARLQKQWAKGRRFINAYGPTEATVCSTIHVCSGEEQGTTVSIGKPISNVLIYILDAKQQPVPIGMTGILYISGVGISRGYLNLPKMTAERFFVDPFSDDPEARMYNSGDLARYLPDGKIELLGRNDEQVKVRGFRIEPAEIEMALTEHPAVNQAVVIVREDSLGSKRLISYIVTSNGIKTNKELAITLRAHLMERLPDYMIPLAFVPLKDRLPLCPNGKLDKKALPEPQCDAYARQAYESPQSNTEIILAKLWNELLGVESVSRLDNFLMLGGDSIQAVSFALQLSKHFGHQFPVQILYQFPVLSELARYIDGQHELKGNFSTIEDLSNLLVDKCLPENIRPLPRTLQPWRNKGRVFMTGVTGFLGAFVLRDLLLMSDVKQVACLVRAKNETHALSRIKDNMSLYGLWQDDFPTRIIPLAGELELTDLGLGTERFNELSEKTDVVFHLGAYVNYTAPYISHKAANVTGTINILKFITLGNPKALHYVSTVSVFGPVNLLKAKEVVYEKDDLLDYLPGLKYDSGYSQSQWVTEQLVWEALKRDVPIAVYRPGFIMGDEKSGAGNPNDFVARLIKGCIQLGAYPILPRQSKLIVPVNYVSQALLQIASDDKNLSKAYHLVPPRNNEDTLTKLFEVLAECGFPLEALPYSQWTQKLSTDPNLENNPLMPFTTILQEPVYGQMTRWEMYEGMPLYDTSNTDLVLGKTDGFSFPHLDKALLQKYLKFWGVNSKYSSLVSKTAVQI